MDWHKGIEDLHSAYLVQGDHSRSDYFGLIRELVKIRESDLSVQPAIDQIYGLSKTF